MTTKLEEGGGGVGKNQIRICSRFKQMPYRDQIAEITPQCEVQTCGQYFLLTSDINHGVPCIASSKNIAKHNLYNNPSPRTLVSHQASSCGPD